MVKYKCLNEITKKDQNIQIDTFQEDADRRIRANTKPRPSSSYRGGSAVRGARPQGGARSKYSNPQKQPYRESIKRRRPSSDTGQYERYQQDRDTYFYPKRQNASQELYTGYYDDYPDLASNRRATERWSSGDKGQWDSQSVE